MSIDNCTHSFENLADSVLPDHFKKLEAAIQSPIAAETLVGFKSVNKELLSHLKLESDFPGCYIFIEGEKPFYVGISRGVINRIVQHLNSDTHYSASLVYRMASKDYQPKMTRGKAMKDELFYSTFLSAQKRLRQMKIAFVEIDNDLELYLFEVFAAIKLGTDEWNTFRTH